jgi:hypothetical protein
MRSITKVRVVWQWRPLLAGLCLAAGPPTFAATTLPDARLAGRWQLDASASDNYEAQLQQYLAAGQQALRRRDRQHHNMPLTPAETVAAIPDELPPEPQDTQRARLADSLRPPGTLVIALAGDTVTFTGDNQPASSMTLGEKMIRVDASGSAEIQARAAGAGLNLKYSYLGGARRSQQYALGSKGDTLQVTLEWQSRDNIKLTVRSLYRRQGL